MGVSKKVVMSGDIKIKPEEKEEKILKKESEKTSSMKRKK